jgi:hypothetical protein
MVNAMRESARRIDFPGMDTGSPSPVVIWTQPAFLLFYGPETADSEVVVIVKFDAALGMKSGPPSDDSLMGHRLWGKGLHFYSAHVIDNSDWIRELEPEESHRASAGWVRRSHTHYLFTFHDETIEILARGHSWTERETSMPEALAEVVRSLQGS